VDEMVHISTQEKKESLSMIEYLDYSLISNKTMINSLLGNIHNPSAITSIKQIYLVICNTKNQI
jgi:hypothetical protein